MNKKEAYDFLDKLLKSQESDEQKVYLLQDVIVHYFLCPDNKLISFEFSDDIVAKVSELVRKDLKLEAVKLIRENNKCGLKEALDIVNDLTKDQIWVEEKNILKILARIQKDYKI